MAVFERQLTTIGDTPIFHFHDYGRKGKIPKKSGDSFWMCGTVPSLCQPKAVFVKNPCRFMGSAR